MHSQFNNILCISFLIIFKAQPGDSSDLHPLREIASVIMTSSGFISETREGRMADSKTPGALSRVFVRSEIKFFCMKLSIRSYDFYEIS